MGYPRAPRLRNGLRYKDALTARNVRLPAKVLWERLSAAGLQRKIVQEKRLLARYHNGRERRLREVESFENPGTKEGACSVSSDSKQIEGQPQCDVRSVPCLEGEWRAYRGVAQPFAAHSHGHYVIGRVSQGERIMELNGRTVAIGPGYFIAFNPGDVHSCRHTSPDPFAYDSVTIAAPLLDGAVLALLHPSNPAVAAAFDTLADALDAGCEDEILECALSLASLLEIGKTENEGDCDTAETSAAPLARSVATSLSHSHEEAALRTYAHLREHLTQPAGIAKLARAEGLSPYALIRAYRRQFAITPLQHLISLRVERACQLLATGIAPAEVAAQVGFADQPHLTRAFKQRIGTTPAAYQRMSMGCHEACPR